MTTASACTVGCSNRIRTGASTPNASRTRDITCVASSECPPSAKKLSYTPTCSTRSTTAQIPASTSSAGVRGATYAPPNSARPHSAAPPLRAPQPRRRQRPPVHLPVRRQRQLLQLHYHLRHHVTRQPAA